MPSHFRTAKHSFTKRVAPDYTNQLDLFSEAPPEMSELSVPAARVPGTARTAPRSQQLGFEVWEPLPAFDAAAVAVSQSAPEKTAASNAVVQPSQREIATPDERPTAVVADERRNSPVDRVLDIEPEKRPPRDFRIAAAHRIGQGSLHEKARDNIAAIKLLKDLEVEDRDASDDEKAVLSRYVGWGALSSVFGPYPPEEWRSTARTLKELLTGPELESARASTPNAHYTSPLVIEAVWNALRRLGVASGAQILEPSMGVGHFFGLMPEAMEGVGRTGVELDSITARIARKLYPDSTIFAKGFEDTPLPDNYFDVILGNVPFG